MYKATSFLISKKWEQTKCHQENEYTHALSSYNGILISQEKKEWTISIHATMWKNFKSTIMSEWSQMQNTTLHKIWFYKTLKKANPILENRLAVACGWGRGGRDKRELLGWWNILNLGCGGGYMGV